MRKFLVLLIAVSVICPSLVSASGSLDDAAKYYMIGMRSEGDAIIQSTIKADPFNAKNHFKIGQIYLENNINHKAKEHFTAATKLDPSYKAKVARIFEQKGFSFVTEGKQREAVDSFRNALSYDNQRKKNISSKLYHQGKSNLDNGDTDKARTAFNTLHALDNSYDPQIADSCFQCGTQSETKTMLALFAMAIKYDPAMKGQVADQLTTLTKSDSLSTSDQALIKKESKQYLTKAQYDKVFPVVWVQVGPTHTFVGKGMGKHIKTLKSMVDFQKGDKIIISGKEFRVMDRGWKYSKNGNYTYISLKNSRNTPITVDEQEGESFSMSVYRKM